VALRVSMDGRGTLAPASGRQRRPGDAVPFAGGEQMRRLDSPLRHDERRTAEERQERQQRRIEAAAGEGQHALVLADPIALGERREVLYRLGLTDRDRRTAARELQHTGELARIA